MNNKKGFTLIELLVVIAIIGILSGIVLTSLGTARNKAKQSSAVASASSLRSEMELNADTAGTYPAICVADTAADSTIADTAPAGVVALRNAITANVVAPTCRTNTASGGRVNTWVVSFDVDGSGSGTDFYCVDSAAFAGQGAKKASGGGAGPAVCA